MNKLVIAFRVATIIALAIPVLAGERASAGITMTESATRDAATFTPASSSFAVAGDNVVQMTNAAAAAPADPNEVLTGILSNGAEKPGTPAILGDISKAGSVHAADLNATRAADSNMSVLPVAIFAGCCTLLVGVMAAIRILLRKASARRLREHELGI